MVDTCSASGMVPFVGVHDDLANCTLLVLTVRDLVWVFASSEVPQDFHRCRVDNSDRFGVAYIFKVGSVGIPPKHVNNAPLLQQSGDTGPAKTGAAFVVPMKQPILPAVAVVVPGSAWYPYIGEDQELALVFDDTGIPGASLGLAWYPG